MFFKKIKREFTLPNLISFTRALILVPLILAVLLEKVFLALALILLAAVSDGLDGFLARNLNQVSFLGKIIDPVADKILIIGCLIVLIYKLQLSWFPFLLIFFLEAILVLIGTLPLFKKELRGKAGANIWGKCKFTTQVFLIIILAIRSFRIYQIPLSIIWGNLAVVVVLQALSIVRHLKSFAIS